jgi:hypothetical protein
LFGDYMSEKSVRPLSQRQAAADCINQALETRITIGSNFGQ